MATGTTLRSALEKISRNHLECSICHENYQNPKVLDCQHSFCEQCLVKYRRNQHRDAREIPCPLCRRQTQLSETGIEGLKTNFYIVGLAEDLALQEKLASSNDTKPLCEICDEGNEATHRCLDCAQNICPNCRKAHPRFAASLSHIIATMDDIRHGKVTLQKHQQQKQCKKHKGEVTRFYCQTCEQHICIYCTVIDHCKPTHEYIDCNQAASTYKQSVNCLFSPLEAALGDFLASQENISRIKRKLGNTVEEAVAEVRAKAAEIKTQVTAEENRIINEIRRLHKDRNEKLDECRKTVEIMTEGIQYSLETAKDVTSTASDSDFLSLYPTIIKDLTFLVSQNPPAVDERLAFLKFKQSQGTGDVDLGELQLEEGKWKLLREFRKAGSRPGKFAISYGIAGLEQDEIAVADYFNKRLVICSTKGYQNSVIPLQAHPLDVAATRTRDRLVVVCSGATDVKVFKKDRKLAFKFPTVPRSKVGKTAVDLRSVAVKTDGTIVVGDVKRKVLTEHSPTDGSLIRTLPVKRAPLHIAVDCSDRKVISSKGQEVDVMDCNGTTLFNITPTIGGKQVQRCNGVYCDNTGIYIAMLGDDGGGNDRNSDDFDESNYSKYSDGSDGSKDTADNDNEPGHIHHYDTMGNYICCVAKGLHHPKGIAFTADGQHLAVADWTSVKMYHVV